MAALASAAVLRAFGVEVASEHPEDPSRRRTGAPQRGAGVELSRLPPPSLAS